MCVLRQRVRQAEVAVDAIEAGVVLADPSAPVGPVAVAGTSTTGSGAPPCNTSNQ